MFSSFLRQSTSKQKTVARPSTSSAPPISYDVENPERRKFVLKWLDDHAELFKAHPPLPEVEVPDKMPKLFYSKPLTVAQQMQGIYVYYY